MNTNAFVTFNTLLLVVVYLLVAHFDSDPEENMAKFIPDHALIYFEQRDAKLAVEAFSKSQLGQKFESINFRATGNKIWLSDKIIDGLETVQKKYQQFFANDILNELMGNRFATALFWPEHKISDYTLQSFLKENSLIVAEPEHNTGLLKQIATMYSKPQQAVSLQMIQYGTHQISRLTTAKGRISYALIDGLLIASFNERLLKQSIDAYDGELASIYDSDAFKKSQEEFINPQRFIYFPIETIKKMVQQFHEYLAPDIQSLLQSQLVNSEGFSGISYGAWPMGNRVQDKIIFSYDENRINPVVQQHLKTAPSTNSMLDLTTADPLAYYWSNSLDVRHFLNYLPHGDNKTNPIIKYIKRLEDISHLSVEEILGVFDEEISLVVEKSSEENFIPVPLGAAFFRVDPQVDLSEIVNYIVDAFGVPVIEQVYNSVTYLYWVASPQDGLQPLCGYWSNIFFIGNSAQLIERVIDGYNENTSLLSNPKVKDIDPGMTLKNNSVTYFNNVEMIELLQRMLSAISTMISLEDRGKAAKAQIVISEVVNPLLDGLKEYDKSCTRSYFAPGMVVIDSRTNIAQKNNNKGTK
ncbi:MAG: hypothetical protein COA36_10785 [Desulfotalea sp.]|nr:MAG: hypothetical protein COA36_10785 [Desulfotalea sp.]